MLEHMNAGAATFLVVLVLSAPAWSSAPPFARVSDRNTSAMPVVTDSSRELESLGPTALKALFRFALSPQERQRLFLQSSHEASAGVPLPDSPIHAEQPEGDPPVAPPHTRAPDNPLSGDSFGFAAAGDPAQGKPRESGATSTSYTQWLMIVTVGVLLTFFGGAVALVALVVSVSLLSRGSGPLAGIGEESAHGLSDKQTPESPRYDRSNTAVHDIWKPSCANSRSRHHGLEY